MAGFRGHMTFSTALGAAYGGLSWWQLNVDWPVAAVGGLLTAVAGMLPDIDSDSGIPMREISNSVSAIAPLVFIRRIAGWGLSPEEALLITIGIYCAVRFLFFGAIRRLSVHRGMFHSIPAMMIAGLATFLILDFPSIELRGFLAVGVMLGFLSHLVLDELCSVDLTGVVPKLNKFAGTAVKFWSPSLPATAFTYLILGGLVYLSWNELPTASQTKIEQQINVAANSSSAEDGKTKGPLRRILGFRERPQTIRTAPMGPAIEKAGQRAHEHSRYEKLMEIVRNGGEPRFGESGWSKLFLPINSISPDCLYCVFTRVPRFTNRQYFSNIYDRLYRFAQYLRLTRSKWQAK